MESLGLDIGEKRGKADNKRWIDANIADPGARAALYKQYGLSELLGTTAIPGGALPMLQQAAIDTTKMPQGPDMLTAEQQQTADRAKEVEARLEAAATEQSRIRPAQRNTAVDTLRGERDPVGPNLDWLQELVGQATGGKYGIPSQAQDFGDYDAKTRELKAAAYISRGLPVPADLASPTPTSEAADLPTPTTRPTPMATPRPQGTTAMVDLNKAPPEADRQADATKEARLKEEFLLNWVHHEGWNAPRSGARWNSKWSAFMAANGL
jgi:hypothetical protein